MRHRLQPALAEVRGSAQRDTEHSHGAGRRERGGKARFGWRGARCRRCLAQSPEQRRCHMPLDHRAVQQGGCRTHQDAVAGAHCPLRAVGAAHDTRKAKLPCWAFTAACAPQVKQRTLWSRYFEVGGYDWRLLVYPSGDSQALPGYISLYVQVGRATPTPVAFAHRTACILVERRLVCSVHAATLHGAEGPVPAKASDSDGKSEERSVRRRGCWDGSGGFSCVSDSQPHKPS